MWRCKISWRKMWRCKISWRKIWRCKISWRKIWRCIISAPFSRRTLCSGALGKNLHGLLWLYSFRCLLLLRHPAKPGTCMIRACNPCIWINLVSQLSQSVHWQVHHGSFFIYICPPSNNQCSWYMWDRKGDAMLYLLGCSFCLGPFRIMHDRLTSQQATSSRTV